MLPATICLSVSERKTREGVVVVTQFNRVDGSEGAEKFKILTDGDIQFLGAKLFALVDVDGYNRIIVNFVNASFLSCVFIGKLITLDKKVKAKRGKLFLCSLCPEIYEIFSITGLDRYFNIQENEDAALEQFGFVLSEETS